MLLYGSLLRCLDPVLTIAAAQGWGRPVFWSTPDKREEVGGWMDGAGTVVGEAPPSGCQGASNQPLDPLQPAAATPQAEAARRSVAAGVAVSKSDHLAIVAAYNSWRAVVEKEGRQAAHEFCGRSFLADQALEVRA